MATARDRAFRRTALKLGIFATVMILVFAGLVVVFSQYRSNSTNSYSAVFSSASHIKDGATVRIAGVRVGSVTGVNLDRDNRAVVDFDVDKTDPLPATVHAAIRYENLTGDRYMEISEGPSDPSTTLRAGSRIPMTQTEPALDLDKLLGGFKPLFATLKPHEVNQLSQSLIQVFQGQGPALTQLLRDTAQFTSTLADRDKLIGSVITNLNATLKTVADDSTQLDTSLDRLQQLISGLDSQRTTIGQAVTSTSALTNHFAKLLGENRPDLKQIVTNTGQVSDNFLNKEGDLRGLLQRYPGDFKRLAGVGNYGAWLQLWLCAVNIYFTGPDHQQIVYRSNDTLGNRTNPGGRCSAPQ